MTDETVDVIFKYAKEPQKEGLRLTVSCDKTLFELTSEIAESTGQRGPFRFVHKGVLVSPFLALRDISDLRNGDVIIFADQVFNSPSNNSSRPVNQLSPNIEQAAPAITRVLKDPIMQMIMNSPDLMKTIFENNPQIQSLRRANPQINAILSDPKEMMDLMKNLSNPATAREMFKASDRALSNADAAIGGMDAIRSLYNDFNQVFDGGDGETASMPTNRTTIESKREIEENPFPRENGSSSASSPSDIPPTFNPFVPMSPLAMSPTMPQVLNGGYFWLNDMHLIGPPITGWPFRSPTAQSHNEVMGAAPRQTDAPEVDARAQYSNQIAALQSMGFDDVDKIIQALKHSNGIINGALDYLTRNP